MKKIMPFNRFSLILLVLCLISLSITVGLIVKYAYTNRSLTQYAQKQALQQTKKAATQMNGFVSQLKPLVHNLADELSKKRLNKNEIEQRLQQKPVEIYGFGVAYLPNAFSNKDKLYAPYFFEHKGKEELIHIEEKYDYSEQQYDWFHTPLKKGAGFFDPYFGQISKKILVEYSAPFYDPDNPEKQLGIVYANQSIDHLEHILSTLYLGRTGYWFIISNLGTFLSHPLENLVHERKTIFDVAYQRSDNTLEQAGRKIIKGEQVFIEYDNEVNNAHSWLICEPIPSASWSVCGVFDQTELQINTDILRQQLFHIIWSALISGLLILLFIFQFFVLSLHLFWITSFSISSLFALSAGFMWYTTNKYPDYDETLLPITSKDHLYRILKSMTPSLEHVREENKQTKKIEDKDAPNKIYFPERLIKELTHKHGKHNHIPTGIFISNLQFVEQNQIAFTGYIWQRYSYALHGDILQGFDLPQAKSMRIKEIHRKKEKNDEIVIWSVQATLDQKLLYNLYPFDVKNLQIQIWHKDFDKNIILTPDFTSYKLINPRSKPGLSDDAYLSGWHIRGSYFGYKKNNYNSIFGMYSHGPFGMYQHIEKSETPELYFDIRIKRYLLDMLISDLLPLIVIALLLFVLLLTSVEQGYAALRSCTPIFFSNVIAQIQFRSKIPSHQFVYFDQFFLLLYVAILAVIIVIIAYQFNFDIWFIQYRKKLIPKLLYWPLLLGALNMITLFYLY